MPKEYKARTISAMPLVVHYADKPYRRRTNYRESANRSEFVQEFWKASDWIKDDVMRTQFGKIDPFEVRESFMRISTPAEFSEFLDNYGAFREVIESRRGGRITRIYTWQEVLTWQRYVASVQLGYSGPVDFSEDYLTEREMYFHNLRPRLMVKLPSGPGSNNPDFPEMYIMCSSSLEVILSTLFIDRVTQVEYDACAWGECGNLFQKVSNHARACCSQSCANKYAQKVRRQKARQLGG